MTPRRIALTIIGFLLFGSIYTVYDRLLGWIDGLPLLPAQMLNQRDNAFKLPPRAESPVIKRLKEAFGESCPEAVTEYYPTQLEFRNGDTSTIVAAGQFPSNPGSNRVELTPFSVAVFGKARPEHLRQPGEAVEISTFHSDKAVLEFDSKIMTPVDMSTATLVRIELISDPEQTLRDKRMGRVHITNNQRSSDENRRLLMRTIGPVIYRDTKVFVLTTLAFAGLRQANVPETVMAKLNHLKDNEFSREDFGSELSNALTEKELDHWKNTILNHASASPNGSQRRLGPDIWTDAPIEVIDHSNIPRREGVEAAAAPTTSDEVRNVEAVANILMGQRLPPPTVTAIGMKVYLANEAQKDSQSKKGSGGVTGVRRIDLLQQVTMHLWLEGGGSLVGSEGKSSATPEASPAAIAVGGGLIPAIYASRELGRDLLQIETRGPFAYDAEKNLARFDVLPHADPNLTNDVRATKIPPRPGIQTLFSEVLELEFKGSSDSEQPPPPAKPAQPDATAKNSPSSSGGGPQIKRLHAWTFTPGRFLTVSSDADQTEAYAQDLVRVQATETTQLTGSPLYAVQQRSILTAGGPSTPGVLISEPVNEPLFKLTEQTIVALKNANVPETVTIKLESMKNKKGSRDVFVGELNKLLTADESKQFQALIVKNSAAGPERRTTILGPGRLELYDPAAKANTTAAEWKTSMVQTKECVNDRELDLYTLTDGAKLEDLQSGNWLKSKDMKLWMAPSAPEEGEPAKGNKSNGPASPASKSQINRLLATTNVTGHSNDLDIDHAELFNALFRDIPPPEPAEPAPMPPQANGGPGVQPIEPANPIGPQSPVPPPPDVAPQAKEPEKPKPPMKVKAREINAWVVRYPQPKPATPPAAANAPAAPAAQMAPPAQGENGTTSGGMKYQLEKARCEGMVVAHQDPDDPSKPQGTDIVGSVMVIDSTPEGSKLTVHGWDFDLRPGEVHNEGTSLIGPVVVVDQLHNYAKIDGRGSLVMPANSDLTGADVKKSDKKPEQKQKSDPVVVHFRDKMEFWGTEKRAMFTSKVIATQGEASIICDSMQVILDRPVYFTQSNRPSSSPKPASSPPAKPAGNPPQKSPNSPPGKGPSDPDEDKAKIEVVYCYPAPADTAESRQDLLVYFKQIDRDAETGKEIRRQQLSARGLTLRAQVKDESRGEPYRMVEADGPGVARIWAPESRDEDSSTGSTTQTGTTAQTGNSKQSNETEMKLTVIFFSGRMISKDKGDVYKEATFYDNIQTINLPTDNPDLDIERHKLPKEAMQIDCRDKLKVWSHKNPRTPDDAAIQNMHAFGNAYLRNDEYEGWGDEIRSEGKIMWFESKGLVPARIKARFKQNDNSGEKIRVDRAQNRYTVIKSIGGTIVEGNGVLDETRTKAPPAPANPSNNPNNKNNGMGNQPKN